MGFFSRSAIGLLKHGGGRIGIGAVGGGIVGGITAPTETGYSSTAGFWNVADRAMGVARGAVIGAFGGAATTKAGFGLASRLGVGAGIMAGGLAAGAGTLGAKAAWRAGKFAWRQPLAAAAIAGGTAGAYGLASMGPSGRPMGVNEMAGLSTVSQVPSTGFMPGMGNRAKQDARMMFADSTFGLVQGLHRGRH